MSECGKVSLQSGIMPSCTLSGLGMFVVAFFSVPACLMDIKTL